jgi:phospholipase C
MVNSVFNNWLIGHWSATTENYYAEGWVTNAASGTGANDTNWRIYAATGNSVTDTWANYNNGVLGSSNNGGSQGPNGLAIGVYGAGGAYNSEFSTGEFSFVLAYNRVLTATEIKQNFFAYRNRFGI